MGDTAATISRKGIPQNLNLNFKDKFSFLNTTAIAKRVVEDSLSWVSYSLNIVPLFFFLFFVFCFFCYISANETTVMINREVNIQESGFAYFKEEKFSHLNITALVKRFVDNSLSCAFSCLNNLACFSFNFAAFPDKAGKFTCEILSSDKYNNSKGFLPSKIFHHFSIVVRNLPLNFALTIA